ncbi:MAG: hypothetical protein ACREMT_10640 [Vulcanimicrobiaceae bacterium]
MNDYGDLFNVSNLVAQIVARDVGAGVEMARSLGYKMPTEYDVGFLIVSRELIKGASKVIIRIRLDDVTYDSGIIWPTQLTPRGNIERLMAQAFERLRADAVTLAHIWYGKHHEAAPTAIALGEALKKLNLMQRDDVAAQKWMRECAERAKSFTYKTEPRR